MTTTKAKKAYKPKPQPLSPDRAIAIIKDLKGHLIPDASGADHMRPIYLLLTCALSSPAWPAMYEEQIVMDDLSLCLERLDAIHQILDIQLMNCIVK